MTSTALTRSCENCCAFIDGECINMVSFSGDHPGSCNSHETTDEYQADERALERFRVNLGLHPKMRIEGGATSG